MMLKRNFFAGSFLSGSEVLLQKQVIAAAVGSIAIESNYANVLAVDSASTNGVAIGYMATV